MRNVAVLLVALLAGGIAMAGPELPEPIAEGPFKPSWESLMQNEHPQWFRDAKFGIWAHWSAQCVPEYGDWYARLLYRPAVPQTSWEYGVGQRMYKFHVEKYGHPSQFGFKDVINLWKAEKWEPEKLLALYKRAGAKYFVALANHHCNFDAWDSRHHAWNSMRVGPRKDIIGGWAEAARKNGMHFGVSVHAARAWEWYEAAQGADKDGPYAGVPYDGKLTAADGKGKWWDGLDPQELYCQNHKPGEKRDAAYAEQFYLRTKDLIDQHRPELIYYDDWRLPMNETVGLNLAAHLYNSSIKWNGSNQAVMQTKGLNAQERRALTMDIEKGKAEGIETYPWQSDTCIGGWHYNIDVYKHGYKGAGRVLQTLADVVSKNGNLLLSVPMRGDGTIDEKEEKILEDLAAWMEVNGEAIFETRPWVVFGEGPTRQAKSGMFSEDSEKPFGSRDIRFTTKAGQLYAIVMAWPDERKVVIGSLGKAEGHLVRDVQLLGYKGSLKWEHGREGLLVELPERAPCSGPFALRISGDDLMRYPAAKVEYSSKLTLGAGPVRLSSNDGELHGKGLLHEAKDPEGNIGGWTSAQAYVSWSVEVAVEGERAVTLKHAGPATRVEVSVGESRLICDLPATDNYERFTTTPIGRMRFAKGAQSVTVRSGEGAPWRPVNLAWIRID